MSECVEKTLEQTLKEEGQILTVALGVSMLPCIRAKKDILHLVSVNQPPELYDIVLYRRKNGALILHRILGRNDSGYVLCGDNQYLLESGIKEQQILGVLQGFYRGDDYIECGKDPGYQIYVRIWCFSLTLRKWLLYLMNFGRKLWGKYSERFRWK